MFVLGYLVAIFLILVTLAITGCSPGRQGRHEAQRGGARDPGEEPCRPPN